MTQQELGDAVCERIELHLPGKATDSRRTGRDNRLFVKGDIVAGAFGCTLAGSASGVWAPTHRLPPLQPMVQQRRLGESFQGIER